MARYVSLYDSRFGDGAVAALKRVHNAVALGDDEALDNMCEASLADSLKRAAADAVASKAFEGGSSSAGEDFCQVLRRPSLAWWTISVGLERGAANWRADGLVDDDHCALDMRRACGVLAVVPRAVFAEHEQGLRGSGDARK